MDVAGNKGGQDRDRHDQGGGPQHGLPGDRLGHTGPRRRRHVRRLPLAYAYAGARTCALPTALTALTATPFAKWELGKDGN